MGAGPGARRLPYTDAASGVRVVYLDRDVAVVEKPAGLASVLHPADRERLPPGSRPPTLERLLPPLLKRVEGRRAPKGRPPPVRVVQRLDAGTSGLLVFARNRRAERALGTQFRRHSVERRYVALVRGRLEEARRIESLLAANRGDGLRGSHPTRGRRAVTHVRPLEALGDCTLVECTLETGRTHQIRIHLAEQGHPLCGETVYNRPRSGAPSPDPSGATRLMLHAATLGFRHPATEALMSFTMAPPEDFQAFVDALRQRAGATPEAGAGATGEPERAGTGERRPQRRRGGPGRGYHG